MAAQDFYDVHTALAQFAPGVVITREIETALLVQYQANGFSPLSQAQVLAVTGPLPVYPSGMPRFVDSNPASLDDWAIDRAREVGSP